jgi:hypothetical protein
VSYTALDGGMEFKDSVERHIQKGIDIFTNYYATQRKPLQLLVSLKSDFSCLYRFFHSKRFLFVSVLLLSLRTISYSNAQ